MVSASSYCAAGFALNCCQQRHSCTHYSSCMADMRHRCIEYSDGTDTSDFDSHSESSELMLGLRNSSFYENEVPGQCRSAILFFNMRFPFQLCFSHPHLYLSPSVSLIIFTYFLSNSDLPVAG